MQSISGKTYMSLFVHKGSMNEPLIEVAARLHPLLKVFSSHVSYIHLVLFSLVFALVIGEGCGGHQSLGLFFQQILEGTDSR